MGLLWRSMFDSDNADQAEIIPWEGRDTRVQSFASHGSVTRFPTRQCELHQIHLPRED